MEIERQVRVIRSKTALAGLLGFVAGVGVLAGSGEAQGLKLPAMLFGFLAIVGSVVALVRAGGQRKRKLRLSPQGLEMDGALVPRDAIEGGYVIPERGASPARVVLRGKQHISIDVAGREQGDEVLGALGLGASQHAVVFNGVASTKSLSTAALFGGLGLGLLLFTMGLIVQLPLLTVIGAIAGLAAPILFVGNEIHVGSDGVLVQNRLDSHFFSYEDMVAVEPSRRGIQLKLRRGVFDIPISSHITLTTPEKDQQAALLNRVREGMKSFGGDESATVAWRLDRRERPIGEWLRGIVGEEGFREASVPSEELRHVLASHSSPWVRLAAAMLLVKRGGEDEKAHVRIAAEACAAPKLRIAMESIAEGTAGEALAEVAAEVEAEEVATARLQRRPPGM